VVLVAELVETLVANFPVRLGLHHKDSLVEMLVDQ
jgi:hypothetical protein